ncbi:E3 ubiquitin-protein ligase UPL1 [Vitis vinifera]|uniref:E3 ubiquitin-protein ligase UPL1 n=1 Tax=Vitis vinifera TaxID=29760 RepID=A0A438DHZ2_VITVI|nr:E3 ubiquitin-protein ligase UPL1 [Vitis vinifera]
MDELHTFGETEKALLSSSSFDGAAILRVLLALSSLVASLNEKENDQQVLPKNEQIVVLSQVWDINAALEPLWLELSTCITKIESYLDFATVLPTTSIISTSKPFGAILPLPAGNQNILPYIKSFFVMCEKLHLGQPGLLIESTTSVLELGSGLEGDLIDGHQARPILLQGSTPHDSTIPPLPPSNHSIQQDHVVPPPPPPLVQSAPQAGAFVLHGQTETTPHSTVAPAKDGSDDLLVAALPAEFHMPDIERYTRIGCPSIHLQLYSAALYGIENGIAKGLWVDSSLSDSKGKKPWSGSRPLDVDTSGMMSHRSPRRPQALRKFLDTPYLTIQHDQYRLVVLTRPPGPAYLHPPS